MRPTRAARCRRPALREPAAAAAACRVAARRRGAAAEPHRPQPPAVARALAGAGRPAGGRGIEQAGLETAARRRRAATRSACGSGWASPRRMLGDPPVLMLDEPFNGMDPEGIVWMRGFLRSLAAEGRAVLVSSHLMSELQDTADHLVVVGRGKVIADTSVAEPDRGRVRGPGGAAHGGAAGGDGGAGARGGHRRRHRPRHADHLRAGRPSGSWRCSPAAPCRSPRCPRTGPRWRRPTWSSTRDAVEFRAAGDAGRRRRRRAMSTHERPYRSRPPARARTASPSCCTPSGPSSAPCAAGSSAWSSPALLIVCVGLLAAERQHRLQLQQRHADRHGAACPSSRSGRAARRHRQLLLRAPAADRRRHHHRPGHLADRRARQPSAGSPGRPRAPACSPASNRGPRPGSSSSRARARARHTRRCMVTGGHGVRMQYNYTSDIAGPARRGLRGVTRAGCG